MTAEAKTFAWPACQKSCRKEGENALDHVVGGLCQTAVMATKWMYMRRDDWAADIEQRTRDVARAFTPGVPVQVLATSKSGAADIEFLRYFSPHVQLTMSAAKNVLILHPSRDEMERLADEGLPDHEVVVVINWFYLDPFTECWLQGIGATNLANSGQSIPMASPVVTAALSSVANARNPATGVSDGYGKDYAVNALRTLHAAGYDIVAAGLEQTAFGLGFSWSETKQLREYADGVRAGKRYRLGVNEFKKNVLADWEAEATP